MITAIRETDIDECAELIRTSFLTVAEELGITSENAPRFTAFATTSERLKYQLLQEHRPMFAYIESGRIVGYYSLSMRENYECELNNLCVLPSLRHRGIGKQLLESAVATAKNHGCENIKIGIVEENTKLRDWYKSFGFIHRGTLKYDFFPFTCGYMELPI